MKSDWLAKALLIAILIMQLVLCLRPTPPPAAAQEGAQPAQQEQGQQKPPPAEAPAKDGAPVPASKFPNVRLFSYPNGLTGIFDADTGTLYVYDVNLDRCLHVRQVNKLGEPMVRVR